MQTQGLQGVHIIEGMIQLLADSLEFQLLSVQLICRPQGREKRRWRRFRGKCRIVADDRRKWGEGGKKREKSRKAIKKSAKEMNKGWAKKHCSSLQDWKVELKQSVPSKSSMDFSSLAAVLSANSARVSAFQNEKEHVDHPGYSLASRWGYSLSGHELTSLSLSFRTFISSSYLSSFSEYCSDKEEIEVKVCIGYSICLCSTFRLKITLFCMLYDICILPRMISEFWLFRRSFWTRCGKPSSLHFLYF